MERTARMQSPLHRTDARSKLLVTVVFLVTMLSVPLCRLPELLLFFVFPIVACAMGGLSYGTIFRRSLVVLPFVVFIGVFNLFYDREPVFRIGTLAVTAGWVSFLSIVLRGLLSVQALLVLIGSTGYYGLCRSMQRLGVPAVFTTQLLFVYRYLYVLIEEAAAMQQARDARRSGVRSGNCTATGLCSCGLSLRTYTRSMWKVTSTCSERGTESFFNNLPPAPQRAGGVISISWHTNHPFLSRISGISARPGSTAFRLFSPCIASIPKAFPPILIRAR